eukprot:g4126.t1
MGIAKKPQSISVKRNTSDYYVIALMYAALGYAGSAWPRSTAAERAHFYSFFCRYQTTFGVEVGEGDELSVYGASYTVTVLALSLANVVLWRLITTVQPGVPRTHLAAQVRAIAGNMLILPLFQTAWDVLAVAGVTRQTTAHLAPSTIARDVLLWMLVFELTWYVQHRAMHDNYYLWKYGHAYHHTWRKPEHMIGVTNFAFDHVVEPFVTMSSSLVPLLLFPINFYVAKLLSFGYMLLAVFVHWDAFPMRYHLNHHYLVAANFGSHIPIFDMFFGTYHWANGASTPRPMHTRRSSRKS